MPVPLTYPGVYIEELPSGVRTIAGVATSITAFIGRTLRGPTDRPTRVQGFAEFERVYGGLWADSTLSYAVYHFFLNGGTDAVIARVHKGAKPAKIALKPATGDGELTLVAANEGAWGKSLRVRVDNETRSTLAGEASNSLFNLSLKDMRTPTTEVFRNVSFEPGSPRFVASVLASQSQLARVSGAVPAARPAPNGVLPAGADPFSDGKDSNNIAFSTAFDPPAPGGPGGTADAGAADGAAIDATAIKGGLQLLDKTDLFNILCVPPLERGKDLDKATWDAAAAYAKERRAFLIVDAPAEWKSPADAISKLGNAVTRTDNAAIYFPRVLMADPLQENRLDSFAPCGLIAGIYARTDTQRGIWKAPAGIEATLNGVSGLSFGGQPDLLSDGQNGQLNPIGVNCLRSFPVAGNVIWGARTLNGADSLASQWKYVPVRRLALYIEESLYRSTQWVVFEPNDESLWSQIRLNIGGFMHTLFRQGAFQGATPKEAYFVRCGHDTTTQTDIDNGVVNIVVGFAPLRPAEFVVIKIQQIAQQSN